MMTMIERPICTRLATACDSHGRDRGPRRCNLCDNVFTPKSPFERYCSECKETNELLRFVHWLPEADDSVHARLPA
jgi:hypothetical protein